MDCKIFQKNIYKQIDGLLSSAEETAFQEHLVACTTCSQEYEQALTCHHLLQDNLQTIEPPADLCDNIMAAVYKEQANNVIPLPQTPAKSGGKKQVLWQRFALMAAAAALVVGATSMDLFSEVYQPLPPNNVVVVENELPIAPNNSVPTPTAVDTNVVTPQPTAPEVTTPINNIVDANKQPTVTANKQTTPQSPKKPAVQKNETTPVAKPGSGKVDLPKVAYGNVENTMFSMQLLASHPNQNAVLPSIVNNTVEYYLENNNTAEQWSQSLDNSSAPTLIAENVNLPKVASAVQTSDISWLTKKEYVFATSPDNTYLAANTKNGEADDGLWISSNKKDAVPSCLYKATGGNILSWAPNSGKLVFNDSDNNLYVAYIAENLVMPIVTGNIKHLTWSDNSKILVFEGKLAGDAYANIYSVTLP